MKSVGQNTSTYNVSAEVQFDGAKKRSQGKRGRADGPQAKFDRNKNLAQTVRDTERSTVESSGDEGMDRSHSARHKMMSRQARAQ